MCVPVDTHTGTHTRVPPSPSLPRSKPPAASQVGGGLTKERGGGGGEKGDLSADQDASMLGYLGRSLSFPEPACRPAQDPPGGASVMIRVDLCEVLLILCGT